MKQIWSNGSRPALTPHPLHGQKVIVNNSTDEIIGAHLIGHSGEELINIFALAMAHGITAGQIKQKVYAYPTFTSDIKNLLS
jgi:glutathione reductase (NADPH)